ncbi:YbaN family protein [Peiella sedimenti]|uniref:YbaN family protein n=1 Tax=Peiella sedimenti TaxID=3061083 RepID=UPI003CC745AD
MRPDTLPMDLCGFHECQAQAPAGAPGRLLVLRVLGTAAAGAALTGVFLPLLPTTPFALISAWAFARSSPRLEAWLLDHPRLGPAIGAWRDRRAIPPQAKAVAALSLPISWSALWASGVSPLALAGSGLVLASVAAWILTRPH